MADRFDEAGEKFAELVRVMARLRAPGGCPWDRKQTFDTIKAYTLEETYEVMDAIDRRDWPGLAEELGDLLLQPVFFAEMAAEDGTVHDFRFARCDQRKVGAPASACVRGRGGAHGGGREAALGRDQEAGKTERRECGGGIRARSACRGICPR